MVGGKGASRIRADLRRPLLVGSQRPRVSRRGEPVCYTTFQAQRVDVLNREAYSNRSCAVKFAPMGASRCPYASRAVPLVLVDGCALSYV